MNLIQPNLNQRLELVLGLASSTTSSSSSSSSSARFIVVCFSYHLGISTSISLKYQISFWVWLIMLCLYMYLGVHAWLLVCLCVLYVGMSSPPYIRGKSSVEVVWLEDTRWVTYVPRDFNFLDFSLCLLCVSIIFELATFNCVNNGFLDLVGLWYLFVVCGTCFCFNKPHVSPWFVYIYIYIYSCF